MYAFLWQIAFTVIVLKHTCPKTGNTLELYVPMFASTKYKEHINNPNLVFKDGVVTQEIKWNGHGEYWMWGPTATIFYVIKEIWFDTHAIYTQPWMWFGVAFAPALIWCAFEWIVSIYSIVHNIGVTRNACFGVHGEEFARCSSVETTP